ncbi:MAG: hypothetical protein KatS3mg102_2053 [Planctomycetota bacterium]|nr:MAG: hypothetical protein KatS3mg102_2053 [Planctomycetota bacterium]
MEIPAAFPPRLGIGGSATALRITARKIWRRELPELDDELAAALGAQDVAALRERVRASLQREADRRAEAELDDRILEAVLARVEFELPEDLIQVQLDELALSAQLQAQQHGLSEEEALLEAGKARTSADPVVRQRVKARFLLEALAEREGLSVSEEELARRVTEMALQAGRKPEAYLRELQERGLLGRLRVAMRLEKARAYLREKAEVVDVAAARAGS